MKPTAPLARFTPSPVSRSRLVGTPIENDTTVWSRNDISAAMRSPSMRHVGYPYVIGAGLNNDGHRITSNPNFGFSSSSIPDGGSIGGRDLRIPGRRPANPNRQVPMQSRIVLTLLLLVLSPYLTGPISFGAPSDLPDWFRRPPSEANRLFAVGVSDRMSDRDAARSQAVHRATVMLSSSMCVTA